MNRRQRRTAKKKGDVKVETAKVYLDLHCAGPQSEPPVECNGRILITMPFDAGDLRRQARERGWFVTVTCPAGSGFISLTVLCGVCVRKLLPAEVIEAAQRHMPGLA